MALLCLVPHISKASARPSTAGAVANQVVSLVGLKTGRPDSVTSTVPKRSIWAMISSIGRITVSTLTDHGEVDGALDAALGGLTRIALHHAALLAVHEFHPVVAGLRYDRTLTSEFFICRTTNDGKVLS